MGSDERRLQSFLASPSGYSEMNRLSWKIVWYLSVNLVTSASIGEKERRAIDAGNKK